jgi:cyanate lyase
LLQKVPTNNTPYADLPPITTALFQAKASKGELKERRYPHLVAHLRPIIGLTFDDIAKAIGRDEVWVAAAFYGQVRSRGLCSMILLSYCVCVQAKLSAEELQLLSNFLEIPHANLQNELGEHWWPNRGLGPVPPTDPVIYRLYEVRPFILTD